MKVITRKHLRERERDYYNHTTPPQVYNNSPFLVSGTVPPDIIYEQTSSDTTINEGDSVSLRCVAEGFPRPEVKWKREDGRGIVIKTSSSRDTSKCEYQGLEGVCRPYRGFMIIPQGAAVLNPKWNLSSASGIELGTIQRPQELTRNGKRP